jgi:hypothetical protein
MDFSLRSLQSQSGKTKDRRAASKRFQQEDTMNLIMDSVREVYQFRGNKPISVNDLLNQLHKRDAVADVDKQKLM